MYQKLLLSTIPKDFDKNPICSANSVQSSEVTTKNTENKEFQYHKAILLSPNITVFYDWNTFKGVDNFKEAAQKLELSGIGEYVAQKKDNSKKSSHSFIKKNYNTLTEEEKNTLINSIMKYQIQLPAYLACFDLKRSNSNSLMSNNKKNEEEND